MCFHAHTSPQNLGMTSKLRIESTTKRSSDPKEFCYRDEFSENPRYAYAAGSCLISLKLAVFITKILIKLGLNALSTFSEKNYPVTNVCACSANVERKSLSCRKQHVDRKSLVLTLKIIFHANMLSCTHFPSCSSHACKTTNKKPDQTVKPSKGNQPSR